VKVKSNESILEPLYSQPSSKLYEVACDVNTPAIIYDYAGMKDVVDRIQEDLKELPYAKLNLAVKATHTPELLSLYAKWGLGCDVASLGEYELAKKAGFTEITTTNPAYSLKDMRVFMNEGITLDIDSISQLILYGEHFPNTNVGIRVRIPLPTEIESAATFGKDSRFGINILDDRLEKNIKKFNLNITRLHVHTGQMTPQSLLYKADYLFAVASYLSNVEVLDFGGGMFHFYVDREKARKAISSLKEKVVKWQKENNRKIHIRFEPGGALLSGCGYLVTSVMASEFHTFFNKKVITVDSSAWNLAPWHKPNLISLNKKNKKKEKILIAGNTLYEGDFFGKDINGNMMDFELENLDVGDKILFTASGAYTMTNSRRFNCLPLPGEYLLLENQLIRINHSGGSRYE
jgi:diaminopimelate decarboxylase